MRCETKKDAAAWHESGMKRIANRSQPAAAFTESVPGAFLLLQTATNSIELI
jgi:hypothetical protein